MYVNRDTLEYFTLPELRKAHPNVSFPVGGPSADWMDDHGYTLGHSSPPPDVVPADQVAYADGYEADANGTYHMKWSLRPKTAEELAADALAYKTAREDEYPPVGDQLDAIWKQLNYDRLNGRPLIQDADNMLGDILAVKARHPKPE